MSKYAGRWDNKTQADLDDLEARLSGGDIPLTHDAPTLFALIRGWQSVALRDAARDTKARGDIGKEGGVEAWDYLHGRADRLLGMCPTCSGPIRETVNMRCQTCGRDFMKDDE